LFTPGRRLLANLLTNVSIIVERIALGGRWSASDHGCGLAHWRAVDRCWWGLAEVSGGSSRVSPVDVSVRQVADVHHRAFDRHRLARFHDLDRHHVVGVDGVCGRFGLDTCGKGGARGDR
jgi:hypothetical protein